MPPEYKHTVRPLGSAPQFSFSTRTFEQKAVLARLATEWLESFGITYYHTRIGKYLKDIEKLDNAHKTGTVQDLIHKGEFPTLVNSLFESTDLIAIYEGLQRVAVGRLAQQLHDFVKGTEFSIEESTHSHSNKGRDIGFELYMASLFARAGFDLDFGTDADLLAIDGAISYFVECKRPQFDHSVHSNVRAAGKQITRRLQHSKRTDSAHGIIALSISKIVNPDFKLLVASNEQNIDAKLIQESDAFFAAHQQHWRNFQEPGLLGVLLLLQIPAVVENHNLVTTCGFILGNNIVASGKPGYDLLVSVVERLKKPLLGGVGGASQSGGETAGGGT